MPIYEYACTSCGHEFEALQKMSDDPLKDCPECGESQLRKMISAAGFHLKGSGWYQTDFKGGSKAKEKTEKAEKTEAPACGAGACPACATN
jgi:putative FmdB family regulatory protein